MLDESFIVPKGGVVSDYWNMQGIIEELPVSHLVTPTPTSWNRNEIEQLAQSIKEKGILQPVIVRPIGCGFEVVAGKRRLAACKKLGFRKIPCLMMELSDKEAFEVSLVENIQRRSIDPIEEASAYQRYIEEYKWGGIAELAKKIGKSSSYISKRIALLHLPDDVIEKVRSREILPSIAEELIHINDDQEISNLAQLISKRHLTMRNVRSIVIAHNESGLTDVVDKMVSDKEGTINYEESSKVAVLFDRAITSLRLSLVNIGKLIDDIGDEGWIVREVLLQHRNQIHAEIDTLIRQKKRFKARTMQCT